MKITLSFLAFLLTSSTVIVAAAQEEGAGADDGPSTPPLEFSPSDTAIVLTDLQNDFLSPDGVTWGVVGDSVIENDTVNNIERILSAAAELDYLVFISPHYYYPWDHEWEFGGNLELLMHKIGMYDRDHPLSLEGFDGSGADFLDVYKPYIDGENVIVVNEHKVYGPEQNDLVLQLRKRKIDRVVLAGMSANLCVESHLRELLEQGFDVSIISDATAGPRLPLGDGYEAAMTNFKYMASAVANTAETIAALGMDPAAVQITGTTYIPPTPIASTDDSKPAEEDKPPLTFDSADTALVFTDLQNDFLNVNGVAWGAVGESVIENDTINHIEMLLKTAADKGYLVFISPHYYYPFDHKWMFGGALEVLMHEIGMYDRDDPLSLEGFEGSGADWLETFKPYLAGENVIIANEHKVYGPEHNDLSLQLRKRKIDKVILSGMSANLCVESHLRHLLEDGFEVSVVSDATAGPRLPMGDGYAAAMTNFKYMASNVLTTDEAIDALGGSTTMNEGNESAMDKTIEALSNTSNSESDSLRGTVIALSVVSAVFILLFVGTAIYAYNFKKKINNLESSKKATGSSKVAAEPTA